LGEALAAAAPVPRAAKPLPHRREAYRSRVVSERPPATAQPTLSPIRSVLCIRAKIGCLSRRWVIRADFCHVRYPNPDIYPRTTKRRHDSRRLSQEGLEMGQFLSPSSHLLSMSWCVPFRSCSPVSRKSSGVGGPAKPDLWQVGFSSATTSPICSVSSPQSASALAPSLLPHPR
jgi:hypothetical protein